jgi:hypothetical protein
LIASSLGLRLFEGFVVAAVVVLLLPAHTFSKVNFLVP